MNCPECGSENIEHTGGCFNLAEDDDENDTLDFECHDCGLEWTIRVCELPD